MSFFCTRAILLCLVALVGLSSTACNRASEPKEEASAQSSESKPPSAAVALSEDQIRQAGIRTERVEQKVVAESVALTGTISAHQDRLARVTARLPGRIISVNGSLGHNIRAGQVLAMVQSADLGEARAAYTQANSEANVADAALARAETLAADDIIPQKDYLRARADAERARATLRAATDKLRLLDVVPGGTSGAALPVLAPFAGTIIEKKAVVGETATVDQPLFIVADLSTVWLEADVFEKDLARLTSGAKARVTTAAYPDVVFTGTLTYLGDTVDKTTRTVKARIELPNPDRRLKIGMFASAEVASINTTRGIVLPQDAVLLVDGRPTVYVATNQGFVARAVETAGFAGDKTRISAGLAPGERVVTAGAYALKARQLKATIKADE